MKNILLLFFCFATTILSAQNSTGFKGRILDESNQPLPGATILIEDLNSLTSSDFNGYYEFLNLPEGKHSVVISFIGYATLKKEVILTNNLQLTNFRLTPQTNKLDEVIVIGSITKGEAKALNLQKTKQNITNIISADQVGKFPDANIGDALKRVPGIAMQNDQGEARDIIIRGLAPQLNSVTINGDRLPSAEAENRRIQMDLIPSDMIQTIEVNKVVTPDMEGDAIGGSVNLITRAAPTDFRASVTGAFGIAPIREKANYNFSGIVSDRVLNNKLGYVISTSFNSNDYGSDNVEFEWADLDNGPAIAEQDIRRYDVRRDRFSVSLNLDFVVDNNNTFFFKSMFNQRKDWENRVRLRLTDLIDEDENDLDGDGDIEEDIVLGTAVAERETKGGIEDNKYRRLENQDTFKASFGGEHIIFGNIKLDWKTGFAQARERRPNERYITFIAEDFDVTQDFSRNQFPRIVPTDTTFNDPSSLELDEVTEENQYTRERKFNSKINILVPINTTGEYQNSVKFGYAFENKEKLRDNRIVEYTDYVADDLGVEFLSDVDYRDYTIDGYLPGDEYESGNFATEEFLGDINLQNGEAVFEDFVPENYNAKENIHAAYAMLNQNIGSKLSFITGFRVENTIIDYQGYIFDEEVGGNGTPAIGSKDYTNWLPNLQLKYNITNNAIIRAAWSNTIARPNYFDLVPYELIEDEDKEIGNPDLDPTTSLNLDLMGEYYFSNVGIISAGGFYKNLDNFIYSSVFDNDLGGETVQPLNGGTASILGFEIGLQRKLNFLPGFLKNLTVYTNYTFTDSKTDGIQDREDGLALAGAIKNMFNASLAFENKKLSVRASLNYADDYIDEYGEEAFEDRYYDEQLFLDVNASYKITEKLRIFGEAKNLTNQELRFYQGTKNQTMQAEFYNFNWNIGLKYNF